MTAPTLKRGIWFPGGDDVRTMADHAAHAEQAGVDSVWVAEGHLGRDALIALAAIARSTETVQLGTGVVNPFTRHPAQLAAAFATLDEAAGGRVIAGVGLGTRDQLEHLGFDVSKPLATMRDTVTILRRLFARERLAHDGAKFPIAEARLAFKPTRAEVPIYLAAAGPKMCALAGELADGIYLPYGTEQFIERAVGNTAEHRSDRDFDVACQVLMSVGDDVDIARTRVRPGIGFILTEPNGEAVLEANGLDPAKVQRLRDGLRQGGVRGLVAAVDDQIVDRLTIAGTPTECRERLQRLVDLGITHPSVSLLGGEVGLTLEVLAALEPASSLA